MPNFIEIGGVTRKPLVDLTRNDPSTQCEVHIFLRKLITVNTCFLQLHVPYTLGGAIAILKFVETGLIFYNDKSWYFALRRAPLEIHNNPIG